MPPSSIRDWHPSAKSPPLRSPPSGWVGAGRLACRQVSRPPPPNRTCKISLRPALQGSAFLAHDYSWVRIPSGLARSCGNFMPHPVSSFRVALPLVPFALWPAFPASDYYGTTDASQVSLPDCWGHLFQGSLPRSCQWTLRRSLGGGYRYDPSALCGSRPEVGLSGSPPSSFLTGKRWSPASDEIRSGICPISRPPSRLQVGLQP